MPKELKKADDDHAPGAKGIDLDVVINRLFNAIIKRLEGSSDPREKYDYLAKPDEKTIKTMSVLSENQIESVGECSWLAGEFPSMMPMKKFAETQAEWSPSKAGMRAEQVTATMISQETHIVPTSLIQNQSSKVDKKRKKDGEKNED